MEVEPSRKGFAYCLVADLVGCTAWQRANDEFCFASIDASFVFLPDSWILCVPCASRWVWRLCVDRHEARTDGLEADLLALRLTRESNEHRIALFRRETLDPDMMEERARAYMNVAHPDEIIIFNN